MSIATKKGDSGETSLIYGTRVSKNHARVWTYGGVDELNSALGLARAHAPDPDVKAFIRGIQSKLVPLMGELATADDRQEKYQKNVKECITEADVDQLTTWIHEKEAQAGSFSGWEFPGDTIPQAFFDQARTTCRRAERGVVALMESGAIVRPELPKYLNRLSDLLWLLGREHRGGVNYEL